MKISAYNIEKALLQFLLHMIGRLPLSVHHFNAKWIAFLIERVVKYRVALVDENLGYAFPEKSAAERLEIRHKFYIHFANLFVEALFFGACNNPKRLKRSGLVTMKNPELLNEMFDKCPSLMVMNSHAGNWELLSGVQSYSDVPLSFRKEDICVVYRRLHSRVWDEIIADNRTTPLRDGKEFKGYLESKEVMMNIMRNKDRHRLLIFNTDQRPYFNLQNAPSLTFMNRECKIMDGAANIAHRLSFGVVYLRMYEQRSGHYVMELVPICEDASKMDAQQIMKKYYELLEQDLRKQPHNYLWTHNRWWWG